MDKAFLYLSIIGFIATLILFIVARYKEKARRHAFNLLTVAIGLYIISTLLPQTTNHIDIASEYKESNQKTFYGEMDLEVVDNTVITNINTNALDGSIFEVIIMNSNLDAASSFVEVIDGNINYTFLLPSDWEFGFIAGSCLFRFNLDEHPQPEHIKVYYGDNGEYMIGEQVLRATEGNYYALIEAPKTPYPDQETVNKIVDEQFISSLEDLIKTSNGLILKIEPDGSWGVTRVYLSDSWYYGQMHEKERFVEAVGANIEYFVKRAEKVREGSPVVVSFYDSYGKELARQKLTGGYKILQ